MREKLEQVLEEKIRPVLHEHGGEIEVVSLKEGELHFRLLGQCSGCPSAAVTAEELVGREIREAMPEIQKVILDAGVSDEMIDMAKAILRKRHEGRGEGLRRM